MKNNTLLVAGYPYLTESVAKSLIDLLEEDILIYNPYDFVVYEMTKEYKYPKEIEEKLISGVDIDWSRRKGSRLPLVFKLFLNFPYWSKRVVEDIKKIDPINIILLTDIFPSSILIDQCFQDKNILLIQPCLLDAWERKKTLNSYYSNALNFFFKNNPFPKQQYWGLEGQNNKLLLWSEENKVFFEERREEVFLISSPMTESTYTSTKESKEYGYIKKIGIFPVNLTSIYGSAVQNSFEKCISEILNKYKNDYEFIVKVHPHDDVNYWRNRLPKDINLVIHEEKEKIFKEIDIHFSCTSYSSFEARDYGAYTINYMPADIDLNQDLRNSFTFNCNENLATSAEIIDRIDAVSRLSKEERKDLISNLMDSITQNRNNILKFLK